MKALLHKFGHNGSPRKSSPDTDLDLFHFLCVMHSYFSAVTVCGAIRLSKLSLAWSLRIVPTPVCVRMPCCVTWPQHQQRKGSPSACAVLSMQFSRHDSVYPKTVSLPTSLLRDCSTVCRAAGQLFLIITKKAILHTQTNRVFCATGRASALSFSAEEGITLDIPLPGVSLRELLPFIVHTHSHSVYIYICMFSVYMCNMFMFCVPKGNLIAAPTLLYPCSDQHYGN